MSPNDHIGILNVALDQYRNQLAAQAQRAHATPDPAYDAQYWADVQHLWNSSSAAKRDLTTPRQ